MSLKYAVLCLAVMIAAAGIGRADDWPQWRHDAAAGAATAEQVPPNPALRWTRSLPPPTPAWPATQPWIRYDTAYSPIVVDGLLIVGSMTDDSLAAYDLDTGAVRWQFFADGPIRFAPAAAAGRVYCGSDDGYLYCLASRDGKLLWRVRGGPTEHLVLGNQRLISTWPVRGAPLVDGGVVYFAAGIWPFMGIFVHAVDAASGQPLWTNSGDGADFVVQPHKSPAFSGFLRRAIWRPRLPR